MAEECPKLASYKRIILCVDGTWDASDQGDKSAPSNLAKLARVIANSGPDTEGNLMKQIVSYSTILGVGSGDLFRKPFVVSYPDSTPSDNFTNVLATTTITGGLGWGIDIDRCQIYEFISDNYKPAMSYSSLAGRVERSRCARSPASSATWASSRGGDPFEKSAWYLNNKEKMGLTDVKAKVVGAWDTVGELICDPGHGRMLRPFGLSKPAETGFS